MLIDFGYVREGFENISSVNSQILSTESTKIGKNEWKK